MKKERSILGLVSLTVFLDIVGFSILFPLFPAMLEHYLALEGGASAIGRVAARLAELAQENEFAVATLFGGVLGSIYSLLQFVFSPVWGGLSDRIGRRPTLLVTLFGTLASHVLWVFSGSFLLLVVARCLGGVMAGNISTASAVVADSTSGRERAKGMGILGMSIGLGFIFGPALAAAALGIHGFEPQVWRSGFALNPFSMPALFAAALAAANLLLVASKLPETLPRERRGESERVNVLNIARQIRRLDAPGLPRTNLAYFLYLTAFSAMEFTLVFLAVERFDYTPRQNAWMFVFVGLIIALVQGGLVRRLAPRMGEKRVTVTGLVLLLPGFLAIGWAPVGTGTGWLYMGLFFMAVGSALAMPCLSALASRYAPEDRQGLALGTLRSMGSLARALGPVLGGLAYWRWGSAVPYLGGAAFLLLPLFLAVGLPPVPLERAEPQGAGAGR